MPLSLAYWLLEVPQFRRIPSAFYINRRSAAPECPPRECASNRALQTKAFRNVPQSEADGSPPEVIRFRNPQHPLYGRSFRVIRRSLVVEKVLQSCTKWSSEPEPLF